MNFLMNKEQEKSMPRKGEINIITMGCSKNLVDSEQLANQLIVNNYTVVHESSRPLPITIINTCGFIFDAKEQSIEKIMDCIALKNEGKIKILIVYGCLSARYKNELIQSIPEVDAFFTTDALQDILSYLGLKYYPEQMLYRYVSTPQHYAYLKVSEGCSHRCAFCAIPQIRGNQVSKSIDTIVQEAQILVNNGVKELLLVAQDLTYYGVDLNKNYQLPKLVEKLANINGLNWIRLHYAYPNTFSLDLLDLMNQYPNICKYVDMPIQHINDDVLKAMNRRITGQEIIRLLDTIKNKVPDIALRTSLIVGFPGETKKMYNDLENFVSKGYFDRLGVFTYSHEENTPAFSLKDNISKKEKQKRCENLMFIQQDISLQKNTNKIGQTFKVIIDAKERNSYIGRTEYDSPEVDNTVIISSKNVSLKIGEFYNVKINKANHFDLKGVIVE